MMTMHSTCAAVALATLFACAPAQAAGPVHIETSSLTFDSADAGLAETLISDVNGVTTFSLPDPFDSLGQNRYYSGFFKKTYDGAYELHARDGYKITGYSLSGQFRGLRMVLPLDGDGGTPGVAVTRAGLSLADSSGAGSTRVHSLADLNGVEGFTLDSGPLDQTGALTLQLGGYTYGFKMRTFFENGWSSPSIADIGLNDSLRLTVYTTAVPEPHSYALMLAGLALVGGIARRRKRV